MRRAQAELAVEPEPYPRQWRRGMHEDVRAAVDVCRFGLGERIVFGPHTREMCVRNHRRMERGQLLDSRSAERSIYERAVLGWLRSTGSGWGDEALGACRRPRS
jgi:hypothetical protein